MRTHLSPLVAAVLLGAACSHSATGPNPLPDPTVLVTNQAPDSGVYFTWSDQNGKGSTTRVAPLTSQCVKFTGTADSVRFLVFIGDSTPGPHAFYEQWSPWFYPNAPHGGWMRPPAFWTALGLQFPNGSYAVDLQPVAIPPC